MTQLSFFDVMGAPLATCLLFAAVLSYLGVHIIRRQVIFVDLALGQVAALGALVGFIYGLHPTSTGAYLFSVGFTLVAAAIFAVTRPRSPRIPHEAIIGVVFAAASAFTYIVVDRSAHGAERVADILTGAILWATWEQVGHAAAAVVVAGLMLAAVHRRLVANSSHQPSGETGEPRQMLWDFLFYACFGVVISVTVRTAGVLPTFAMLVAPAILGCLVARTFHWQVLLTWAFSSTAGVLALVAAYGGDLDAGPVMVVAHGSVLVVGALLLYVATASRRGPALARVGVGLVLTVAVVVLIALGGRQLARMRWSNPDFDAESLSAAEPNDQSDTGRSA
jgi:zinc/manganese transport system permease protein